MEKQILDIQIYDFAQFIDVLDAISCYKTIDEVKADIKIRKELLKESIRRMEEKAKNM